MTNPLVKFWDKCDLKIGPYFHPEDEKELFKKNGAFLADGKIKTYKEYLTRPEFSQLDSTKLHLSLLPVPYGGDLATADIFILLLNPGVAYSDYLELENTAYRDAVEYTLRQDFSRTEFPFIWLNPEFSWHSGFKWWEEKLRSIIKIIAERKFNDNYLYALRDLSQRLAMVELVPYPSCKFGPESLAKNLSSAQAAMKYIHETVVPLAQTGKKTLIVTRQIKTWRISNQGHEKNIVIYNSSEARGAHLTRNTRGGQAILRRYDLPDR